MRQGLVVRGARLRVVARGLVELADRDPRLGVCVPGCDGPLPQVERALVVAGGVHQPAEHDERGPVLRLLAELLAVLVLQQIDGAIPAIHLEQLRERRRIVRVPREDRLVAGDHGLVERVAGDAPVAGLRRDRPGREWRAGREGAGKQEGEAPHLPKA